MRDIVEIEGKKYVSFRMVVAMVISFYIALFVICSLYVKYDRAKRAEKTVAEPTITAEPVAVAVADESRYEKDSSKSSLKGVVMNASSEECFTGVTSTPSPVVDNDSPAGPWSGSGR